MLKKIKINFYSALIRQKALFHKGELILPYASKQLFFLTAASPSTKCYFLCKAKENAELTDQRLFFLFLMVELV